MSARAAALPLWGVLGLWVLGLGLGAATGARAEELSIRQDPAATGEALLPQGEVEWGYYCAQCHADVAQIRARIAGASQGRADLETRRWLAVFLSRHHAPSPEITVALADWLTTQPE